MPKVVLKDGTVIEATIAQMDALNNVILMTDTFERQVKIGTHKFKLSDIETDRDKIAQMSQQKMFDIVSVPTKKKRNMG